MTSTARSEAERQPHTDAPETRGWKRIVVLMLLALSALVIALAVLVTIGRDVRALRRELGDVVVPAGAELSELQRVLALEMAVQRGPREPADEGRYRDLIDEERQHFARLQPLIAAIGEGAARELQGLRLEVARWHAAVARDTAPDDDRQSLSLERGSYAAALASADRLSRSISARTAELGADVAESERWESRLIASMVLIAALCLAVLVHFARRLHDLVRSERRLALVAQQRRREIEQVNRDKEEFIRGVTHDLKNPVGVIRAYGELLEMGIHGPLSEDQLRVIGRMKGAADQTLRIVEDLLRLARADAASLDLQLQELSLCELVAAVVDDYQAAAEREGIRLEHARRPNATRVQTDPERVREILGNLVTNAVRHTPEGGHIRITVERRSVPGPSAVIRVQDTGPGIPENMRDEVFREFVRGGDSNGSGIGLAISRRIARALGGDLVLADGSIEGAVFELVLPGVQENGGSE